MITEHDGMGESVIAQEELSASIMQLMGLLEFLKGKTPKNEARDELISALVVAIDVMCAYGCEHFGEDEGED